MFCISYLYHSWYYLACDMMFVCYSNANQLIVNVSKFHCNIEHRDSAQIVDGGSRVWLFFENDTVTGALPLGPIGRLLSPRPSFVLSQRTNEHYVCCMTTERVRICERWCIVCVIIASTRCLAACLSVCSNMVDLSAVTAGASVETSRPATAASRDPTTTTPIYEHCGPPTSSSSPAAAAERPVPRPRSTYGKYHLENLKNINAESKPATSQSADDDTDDAFCH